MTKTKTDFFISDLHIGHRNIITFTDNDGKLIRPFSSVEEMDEHICEKWNSKVDPKDRVYVAGDVVMNRSKLHMLHRLHGEKILIMGNHDVFRSDEYAKYFTQIHGVLRYQRECVISHVPMHPGSLERWKYNIHGHLHQNIVRHEDGTPDRRYINVSVERLDFEPIAFEELKSLYMSNE